MDMKQVNQPGINSRVITSGSELNSVILNSKGSWFVRKAYVLFSIITICLILITYIVKIPVIVTSNVVITSRSPFLIKKAGFDCFIDTFLVNNHDNVSENQAILIYQSDANYKEILALDELIKSIKGALLKGDLNNLQSLIPDPMANLGELELQYWEMLLLLKRLNVTSARTSREQLNKIIPPEGLVLLAKLSQIAQSIRQWKGRFILTSSSSGIIEFSASCRTSQFVTTGQPVFWIRSAKRQYNASMNVTESELTKFQKTKVASLKIMASQSSDELTLNGIIDSISSFENQEGNYHVRFAIDEKSSPVLNRFAQIDTIRGKLYMIVSKERLSNFLARSVKGI